MVTRALFRFGSFTLDLERLCLLGPSGAVGLRPKSFEVLRYLVEHPGRVVTKEEALDTLWSDVTVSDESLARCISEVRRALGDEDQRIIKTVPRRGYLFDAAVSVVGASEPSVEPRPGRAAPSLADHASIAVLPFSNLSRDTEQDYFCDGISEDIITELSRFSELLVIARNSSFQYKGRPLDVRQIGHELGVRYVLEGSIRRSDDRVRISAQLIDASTGIHRWAERYDRKLEDVFAIQDEIARTTATLLAVHINKAEAERTLLKPPATWEGHDYFLRGNEALTGLLSRWTLDDLVSARKLLERAIVIDPGYARAHAALSNCQLTAWLIPMNDEYQARPALQRAFDLALKAVELDPALPLARAHLSNALLFCRQFDESLAEWSKVFELNPNFTDWRYAVALIFNGQPEQGIIAVERHMRLDPFSPPIAVFVLGLAHVVQKRFEQAIPHLRESVRRAPHFRNGRMLLAATHALMGQLGEARLHMAELLRIEPGCTVSKIASQRVMRSPEQGAHILEGLRKAGLPE